MRRGCVGMEVVEWRRTADPRKLDSCRLDRLEGAIEGGSPIVSGTVGSFEEVVLLRLIDGRSGPSRLRRSDSFLSATCEMLSSGVTSDSTKVGKLRRRDE